MILTRPPGAALSRYINCLFATEGYSPPGPHQQERILPSGQCNLIIDLLGNEPVFSGPQSSSFLITAAAQVAVVGIAFKPGGAYPFFNLPLDEVANAHPPLDALWGRCAAELRERALAAPTLTAKLDAVECALTVRLARARDGRSEVAFALTSFARSPGASMLAAVTAEIGMSQRRFRDLFAAEVGLTPKLFCRVRRFHRSITRVAAGRRVDWAELAVDCGYYDQAHFIHDFRAFSGANPTYYEQHRVGLNHLAVT
jgi:AraC-like DNA-binding protein